MKPLIALALCLTACGPGADQTPKKAEDITALLKERDSAVASHVSGSVVAVVAERDRLRIQVRELTARLDRIEARLKKLENPPPTYHADPSWNVYVEPIEDVPHYAPCGEGRSSNIVDAKTGKPLCRVDANKGGKPHDGEVRSNGRCDETAGREVYSATLGQWVCMKPSLGIDQAFGDFNMKAGEIYTHEIKPPEIGCARAWVYEIAEHKWRCMKEDETIPIQDEATFPCADAWFLFDARTNAYVCMNPAPKGGKP